VIQNIDASGERACRRTAAGMWCPGLATLLAVFAVSLSTAAAATNRASDFMAQLSPADRETFQAWYSAQTFHSAAVDAYWSRVAKLRKARRARLRRRQLVTPRNYATEFPPKYAGPSLPKSLSQQWSAFRNRGKRPRRRSTLPGLNDFLAASRKYYDFAPERIPERLFKKRYAAEALRHGLTKEQVIRVYALETGGLGTADMVAGIHPIRKTGRPISSAMGYAQLLAANSLNVLQKHGRTFETRLERLYRAATTDARRDVLARKLTSLRRMRAYVNKKPRRWSYLQKVSRTGPGRGVHALNIDGDIGPWMQVIKLRDVKRYAERAGRTVLTPEQLELMNLAGPGTGLEMMTALGSQMPTSNFFSRRAYMRNTIVRGRTGAGLLKALGDRMDVNQRNSGAREFAQVFDEMMQVRQARQ
jgi:hypothetical protein